MDDLNDSDFIDNYNTHNSNREDKSFVMGLINNIRNDANPVSRIQLEECNKLWKRYER